MIIREWKYQDILRISELEKECFPKDAWSYGMFASSFENDFFHGVLAEEGEIAGYGSITVAADTADVENIAVYEPYRQSGLGGKILDALLDIAKSKGVKKVFLEVRVSNSAALKLYLGRGFCGVYARSRYYSDGEDCLVMFKEL